MEDFIYLNDDNNMLTFSDLWSYLISFYKIHPEYDAWGFDEITGGESNFFNPKDYELMKKSFNNYNKMLKCL
jgi:hypothetical protein